MHRPLGPDTIGVPNTGYDGRPAPTSRKPLTTSDHWLWWLPNLSSSQADRSAGRVSPGEALRRLSGDVCDEVEVLVEM